MTYSLTTKLYLFTTTIALVVFSLLFSTTIYAQTNVAAQIDVTPKELGSNEQYLARLVSSQYDLNRADITWYINGELKLEGVGETGFRSTTKSVSEPITIRAVIETIEGVGLERQYVIRPQDIDLLWGGISYVPPFYEGKKLPGSSNYVQIVAMPNMVDTRGNIIPSEELVYTWKQWGIVLGQASGYGKNSIILEGAQIPERPLQVSVEVSSLDTTVVGKANLRIPLTPVELYFYEDKPLEGIAHNKALDQELELGQEEIVIVSEPYFFAQEDVFNGNVSYEWEVNNTTVPASGGGNSKSLTLRKEDDTGNAFLSLRVLNNNIPLRVFQEIRKVINVTLGQ